MTLYQKKLSTFNILILIILVNCYRIRGHMEKNYKLPEDGPELKPKHFRLIIRKNIVQHSTIHFHNFIFVSGPEAYLDFGAAMQSLLSCRHTSEAHGQFL